MFFFFFLFALRNYIPSFSLKDEFLTILIKKAAGIMIVA